MKLSTAILCLMSLAAFIDFSSGQIKKCGVGVCHNPGELCGTKLNEQRMIFKAGECKKGQVCCVATQDPS